MSGCGNCGGKCDSCSGCSAVLELSGPEIAMLRKLGQIPFLPVARRADDETPIYLEDDEYSPAEYGQILLCLETKGLISIDYDSPLKGAPGVYTSYPICGSMALTNRGQQVLDLLDIQGIS